MSKRCEEALELRRTLALNYREIGEELGVSTKRARHMVAQAERRERDALNDPLFGLSQRAINIIRNEIGQDAGPDEVLEHYDSLRGAYNCGRDTMQDIRDWLSAKGMIA